MSNSITLNASMRSNLLSLKNIATQMDKTQLILATGKKVNSAIDNASSYYQARSLTNRAADLTALLDSMGQGIQTIEAANVGIEKAITLLEQAQAVANSALEKAEEEIVARVTTEDELLAAIQSGKSGLIVIDGDITLSENESIILGKGQSLVGSNYFGTGKTSSLTFTFKGVGASGLIVGDGAMVSDLQLNYTTDSKISGGYAGVIQVSSGSTNVVLQNLDINFDMTNSLPTNDAIAGVYAEGNSVEVILKGIINIHDNSPVNINDGVNSNSMYSRGFIGKIKTDPGNYENSATFIIEDGTKLNIETNAQYGHGFCYANVVMRGNSIFNMMSNGYKGNAFVATKLVMENQSRVNYKANYVGVLFEETDAFLNSSQVVINGNSPTMTNVNTFYDSNLISKAGVSMIINNQYYECSYDMDSAEYLDDTNTPPQSFILTNKIAPAIPDIDEEMDKFFHIENDNDTKDKYQQFDQIIKEYDKLLSDCSYQGINLLKGGNLKVVFDENRKHVFNVLGQDITSKALNINEALWQTQGDIEEAINQLNLSITTLRSLAESLGNQYSVITTRINFTEALTDVLETGADDLTLADMNEASAQYLSLQTRQQLAINSLSLASLSARSILTLFY